MTETVITSHGFDFSIQGQGFANARDDFESIVDHIGGALDALPATEVRRIHAGALFDPETGEPTEDLSAGDLCRIADTAAAKMLSAWHNPSGGHVMIAALPNRDTRPAMWDDLQRMARLCGEAKWRRDLLGPPRSFAPIPHPGQRELEREFKELLTPPHG